MTINRINRITKQLIVTNLMTALPGHSVNTFSIFVLVIVNIAVILNLRPQIIIDKMTLHSHINVVFFPFLQHFEMIVCLFPVVNHCVAE